VSNVADLGRHGLITALWFERTLRSMKRHLPNCRLLPGQREGKNSRCQTVAKPSQPVGAWENL